MKDSKLNESVVILTTERCGASWLCAYLSEVHRQLYKDPIYWDFEISRVIAIDPKYNLPKTHCSVYYVPPKLLLERGWDKIIIMQRDWEEFTTAICRYYLPKLTKEKIFKKYPKFKKRLEFYYHLEFGERIDDPRIYYTHLSDLNNYAIDEVNHILEFLEYPMETEEWVGNKCYIRQRPPMFPVRIREEERDWDVQATVINKGHDFDPYQIGMIKEGIKGMMPLVDKKLCNNPEATVYGYMKAKGQYINFEYPNPYKLSPEEYKHQAATVYRIKPQGMNDVMEILGYVEPTE